MLYGAWKKRKTYGLVTSNTAFVRASIGLFSDQHLLPHIIWFLLFEFKRKLLEIPRLRAARSEPTNVSEMNIKTGWGGGEKKIKKGLTCPKLLSTEDLLESVLLHLSFSENFARIFEDTAE